MVELHRRKKIEVIIETPARPLLIDVLNRAGSPGYTLIPAIGGRGLRSAWDRNQLMDAANQVIIVGRGGGDDHGRDRQAARGLPRRGDAVGRGGPARRPVLSGCCPDGAAELEEPPRDKQAPRAADERRHEWRSQTVTR